MTSSPRLALSTAVRNERTSLTEIFLAAPFIIVTASYVPVLAARLGATPLLLGAITSGSALVLALAAAMGRWWSARPISEMSRLLLPLNVNRLQLAFIPLVLLLPAYRAEALVILVLAMSLFGGLGNVTFAMLLPRLTTRDRLSSLVSSRWTVLGLGMAIFTPLLAAILDALPLPWNYAAVCAIAGIFIAANSYLLGRVKYGPRTEAIHASAAPRLSAREILRHGPAASYLLLTFAMHFSLNAASPLITLRLVRDLNATDSDFGWYTAATWAAIAIVGLIAPRLVRRVGTGRIFGLSGVVFAFHTLLLAVSASLPLTWMAGVINGVATVLFQVTAFTLLTETAPPGNYEGYVPLQNLVFNLAIFAAPLVMTGLVSAGMTPQAGLLICVVLRLAAGGVSFFKLRRVGV